MIDRFDVRNIGDLVTDDATRVEDVNILAVNPKLLAALNSAAGKINAACLTGERYSVSDLAGLDGESKAYLVDLNCTVAWAALWRRRSYTEDSQTRTDAMVRSDEELTRLRNGEWVFDVAEAKSSGRADVTTIHRDDVSTNYNLVADRVRSHLYPRRRSYKDI
jgi:hypothetical protein